MSCPDMRDLLHGYADGELDLVHTLHVEQHLRACPACARACEEIQRLRARVQAALPHFHPPETLENRVHSALRQADRGSRLRPSGRWLAAAALVLLALGVWGAVHLRSLSAGQDRLAQEAVASHIRSLMVDHLTDVQSSDRHTVKPWFLGKLDFSPSVIDLGEHGFTLVGGRLDYVNDRVVAAVVYRRRQHVINLLAWPAARDPEAAPRREDRQGYHLIRWSGGGLEYCAVSDLNAQELAEFAALLRQQE